MLLVRLARRGSLHVIIAIPAVTLRTIWWAAKRIRFSSGSNAKS